MAASMAFEQRFSGVEKALFRRINSIVEPLVRRGVVSSSHTPASLVVMESTGYLSGQARRTPLWSLRLGDYRLVSTGRGRRSFWVRNLQANPEVRLFIGGRECQAEAIVIAPDHDNREDWDLEPWLARLLDLLARRVSSGWAFAVLVPVADES